MEDMSYLNNYIKDLQNEINHLDNWIIWTRNEITREGKSKGEILAGKIEIGKATREKEEKITLLNWLKELYHYRVIDRLAEIGNVGYIVPYEELKQSIDNVIKER